MESRKYNKFFAWLKNLFSTKPEVVCEMTQAKRLIAAIDRGGVPLNPAKVNQIARNLGLEVSRKAPVEETITRIRQALARAT
ncbi:MAG: hypothetical protein RLZZ298_180 [Pseudomonadota bacterium]|jgi:energy-converting hydrogenase Eha subunit F